MEHTVPVGHPERADRIPAVLRGARSTAVAIVELEGPAVSRELLETVHGRAYIDMVEAFCLQGGGALDPDTHAVAGSYMAALHAAGAGPCAVDALDARREDAAFIAVRPPGHHAEQSRAMGFCLFNNVAITAAYLREQGKRVAIVDWDVHHGNGTQSTFYRDPDVLYISLHEYPFYPGSGSREEVGEGRGTGTTVNVPLAEGTSAQVYLDSFARIVLPVLDQFSPDWILVSNGYDAHRSDPLGGLLLESEHYGWMARAVTAKVSNGRVILMLEGGYDLDALTTSAAATVEGLGRLVGDVGWPDGSFGSSNRSTDLAVEAQADYWELR